MSIHIGQESTCRGFVKWVEASLLKVLKFAPSSLLQHVLTSLLRGDGINKSIISRRSIIHAGKCVHLLKRFSQRLHNNTRHHGLHTRILEVQLLLSRLDDTPCLGWVLCPSNGIIQRLQGSITPVSFSSRGNFIVGILIRKSKHFLQLGKLIECSILEFNRGSILDGPTLSLFPHVLHLGLNFGNSFDTLVLVDINFIILILFVGQTKLRTNLLGK